MAFSGFAEMFVRFAKVLCFNVPSPFFSLSQFFVVSLRDKFKNKNFYDHIRPTTQCVGARASAEGVSLT